MALNKIELKLGKKVIILTPAQFEELKADMRELDKHHHYFWHNYSWPHWYSRPINLTPLIASSSVGSAGGIDRGQITCNAGLNVGGSGIKMSDLNNLTPNDQVDPPAFKGSILAVA